MYGKLKIENRSAGFTPLEIPKRAPLRRQTEQPLTASVIIGDKKRRLLTGFTLTEVIVASALLIVAIVPILKALTSAHVTSTIIERRTRCLILAQAKLDDIRARAIYNYSYNFQENSVSLDGPYLCDVQATSSGGDSRTIIVSVGYDVSGNNNLANSEIEVTLSTIVAKRQ